MGVLSGHNCLDADYGCEKHNQINLSRHLVFEHQYTYCYAAIIYYAPISSTFNSAAFFRTIAKAESRRAALSNAGLLAIT
jgi:hypothetical protein